MTTLKAKVLFPYEARSSKEISLVKDDIIIVTKQDDSGWSEGKAGNSSGWFPSAFVELIQDTNNATKPPEPKLRGRKQTLKRPTSTRLFGGKDKTKASAASVNISFQTTIITHFKPPRC
jgi:hypothetical protein